MARAQFTAHLYELAVEWALKSIERRSDLPEPHLLLAASLGHLSRSEEARLELETVERLRPGYTKSDNWVHNYSHDDDQEHFLEGLRKAGWED